MADQIANISKGRFVEFYNRVENNDPANSAFVFMVLATSGLESDATLIDFDSFSALVAGATNEVTNTNYVRKTITDADLAALPAPDDTNNRYDVDFPDLVWNPGPSAGDGWSRLALGYDSDTTAGTDANIILVATFDFVVTPDGNQVTYQVNASGLMRAA